MDPQPATAVGFLGSAGRPERLLVTWDRRRAVSSPLDDEQALAVAEHVAERLPPVRADDGRRQVVHWLRPPLDVVLAPDGDGPPRLVRL
ncbi:hypothetical protein ABTZ03_37520 [Kitasatospora sp. NPDC096077]|uniref:hypothetical protein n=1 Tax=Kitasatospora sp. NPDC096077 TaxID=3155544 RepID=UPI0033296365